MDAKLAKIKLNLRKSLEKKKARTRRAFEKLWTLANYARSMYLPVRVSIRIFSPLLMNSGA